MRQLLIFVFLTITASAHADSWYYPEKIIQEKFVFGSTRIVLTIDARKNQRYPDHVLEVYDNGKSVARIPGVHFEQFFASKDNRLFLGLSNSGVPGAAVIVFNHRGEVLLLAHHGLAEFDYCTKSITLASITIGPGSITARLNCRAFTPIKSSQYR